MSNNHDTNCEWGVWGGDGCIGLSDDTAFVEQREKRVQDVKVAWDKLGFWEKDFQIEDLMEWLVDMRRYNLAARILEAIHGSFGPEAVGNCYAEIIHGNIATLSIPKGDAYWISFRERQANRLLRLLKVFIEGNGTTQKLLSNSLLQRHNLWLIIVAEISRQKIFLHSTNT
ncbi:hypothetical protein L211DRAFT_845519 [Terfezia boudieri ATCC MYA-4762]|uniref:Uncharacterized protein n=1 Tax=Terfezia boudieri ATCC MYA-4762 TaxID=1051890 RepID=A0A3N4MJ05_9PEZI|nr:hypothetical protein L211DRAFT_845519 [Terfezia boudieri ATCC MYA-4762]